MFVPRDENDVPGLLAASSSDATVPIALWVDPLTHRLLVDASVTIGAISGDRSNNTAVPGATNIGALVGVATAAPPSYSEGYLVGLSTDLSGALRVTGSLSVGGTTDNSAFTAGTSTGTPGMGFYHATVDSVTDGRSAVFAMTVKRAQHMSLYTPLGDSAMDDTNDAVKTTVVAALPAGANAIGKLAANSGVVIGAVEIAAAQTLATVTTVSTVTAVTDITNAVKVIGPAASGASKSGAPVQTGGVFNTTQPTVTTGQVVENQATARGAQIVATGVDTFNVTVNAALPAGTNAIGKLAANSGVIIGAVEQSGTWNIGTVTTVTTVSTVTAVTAISTSVTPGTSAAHLGKAEDAVAGSGDTGVFSLSVANEAQSTLAADGDYIARAADTKGNSIMVGNIAHDGADAGAPVKIGGKAVNAEPAAVVNNDRANFITDLVGKQITLPYANPENFVSGAITSAMTSTTSTSLIAAPAAGLRNYITTIIVSNAHATVGTDIIIQDGSGGTTLMTIPAAAVYGGAVITLPVPLRQPTTATAIYCANVTTGASTKVSAVGYKGV